MTVKTTRRYNTIIILYNIHSTIKLTSHAFRYFLLLFSTSSLINCTDSVVCGIVSTKVLIYTRVVTVIIEKYKNIRESINQTAWVLEVIINFHFNILLPTNMWVSKQNIFGTCVSAFHSKSIWNRTNQSEYLSTIFYIHDDSRSVKNYSFEYYDFDTFSKQLSTKNILQKSGGVCCLKIKEFESLQSNP